MSKNHFLDANILIGSRIQWDHQYNCTTKYMALEGIIWYTSIRVFKEARGVFQRNRRLINKYINALYEKYPTFSDPLKLDANIERFNRSYERNLHNEKDQQVLQSFITSNQGDIRYMLLGGDSVYGDFSRSISSAFMFAINSLQGDCKCDSSSKIIRYDGCPLTYDGKYTTVCDQLSAIMNYDNDVLVLLDSVHLRENILQSRLRFVTTDVEHFVSKKDEIEGVLEEILIDHPKDHLRSISEAS